MGSAAPWHKKGVQMNVNGEIRPKDEIIELSANIDDMTGEELGLALEEILKAGAVDVYMLPAIMKKNRPGTILNVLTREDKREAVIRAVFKNTNTIGVREKLMQRYVLKREMDHVETPLGAVSLKRSEGYGVRREKPEHDDMVKIAAENDMTLMEVKDLVKSCMIKKAAGKT